MKYDDLPKNEKLWLGLVDAEKVMITIRAESQTLAFREIPFEKAKWLIGELVERGYHRWDVGENDYELYYNPQDDGFPDIEIENVADNSIEEIVEVLNDYLAVEVSL